jgi:hypothetical protein
MVKRGTMGFNVKPTLSGSFNWWNKVDALSTQYLIYTDSYTTERTTQANAIPTCWSTPDLNDTSFVNLVNTIPERIGQLPFTAFAPAYNWLTGTNKYVVMKDEYENIVTDGLVLNLDAGWYNSYPATGTIWTDLSPEGNNGTLINGTSFSTDGQGSLSFDDVDDYVNMGSSSIFNVTNQISLFAWINPSNSNVWNGILGSTGGGFVHFQLIGQAINVYVYGPNIPYDNTDGVTVPLNSWSYLGFTVVDSTLRVYLNGVQLPTTLTGSDNDISSASDIRIGRVFSDDRFFGGKIAAVQMYNTSLTPNQILQNYNTQKFRFGLTGSTIITTNLNVYLDAANPASYPQSGTNWYDLSGDNNSAELLNGPSYSTDGGGSINFDGTDDRGRIPQNNDLYGNTFTWEFWVKFDAFPNTYSGIVWAEGSTGGGSGLQYLLSIQDTSGTRVFHYRISNTVTGWANTDTAVIDFTPTNWTHIVWTFDNGTTKIYTQGSLFHTNTIRGSYNGGTDSPVFIGGRNDSFGSLDGKYGAVNHYTVALDATQVLANYNSTKSRYGY